MTLSDDGFAVFPPEPSVLEWVAAAGVPKAGPKRHGGTWQVGLDALENDADGRVAGGTPLRGAGREAAGAEALHRAQISITHPGYPGRDADETEVAHRYRKARDAAHLDGLLPEGPARRRHLREPHAWILGVALTKADPGAAPLVAWRGSYHVMRRAFRAAFAGHAPDTWGDMDVTEAYQAARREVFETCERVPLPLPVGGAVLLHRLCLHGVAPWEPGAKADPRGRAVAYFRPCLTAIADWLDAP